MGVMQLTDFRDALRYSLFNRADLSTTQLDRWLNWSYLHVCQPRVFRHRELMIDTANTITLSTGVMQYDITSTTLGMSVPFIYQILYIVGTDSADLALRRRKLRGGQDIRQFATATIPSAEPTHYALFGTDLWVYPKPSSTQNTHVIQLMGVREPTRLTNDDQPTVVRESFDEVILLGARWRGWRELGRFDMAEIAKADFVALLGDLQEPGSSDAEDWGGYFQPDADQYERSR
jgi:hypothetical protein